MTRLEITGEPEPDDIALLGKRLGDFNDADVGASERQALAVFVRDDAGTIVAGISGYTGWGWLFVQWLWVDETWRGRHLASRMLDAAEAEAVARGCHGAWIDTFNPIALKTYERQGYQAFGVLSDFPVGRSRTFLQKRFAKD